MMRFDGSFGSGMRCAFSLSMIQMASHTSLMVMQGLGEALDLVDVGRLDGVERLDRVVERRHRLGEVSLDDSFSAFTLSASAWATAASAPTSACLA